MSKVSYEYRPYSKYLKVKVMVRSNEVTNEMLHECRVTHVVWVIWDVEFDSGIHFLSLASENVNVRLN